MAAELETQVYRRNEADVVFEWRFDELVRVGFPDLLALKLALTNEVDLHAAMDLRSRGCPPDTAARILL